MVKLEYVTPDHPFLYIPTPFLTKCRQNLRDFYTFFLSRDPAYNTRFFKYCRQYLSRLFSKTLKIIF